VTLVNTYSISSMIHNLKWLERQSESAKENEAKEQKRHLLMKATMVMVQIKTVVMYKFHATGVIQIRS
jgi:hypothetical protein